PPRRSARSRPRSPRLSKAARTGRCGGGRTRSISLPHKVSAGMPRRGAVCIKRKRFPEGLTPAAGLSQQPLLGQSPFGDSPSVLASWPAAPERCAVLVKPSPHRARHVERAMAVADGHLDRALADDERDGGGVRQLRPGNDAL